jgi:hypothetical protein
MTTKIFDADQVAVSAFGFPINSGYADGEFVRIERDAEDFTLIYGTDGESTRSKTNKKGAKITLTLMQTSDSNILLNQVSLLDRTASNGAGIGALSIEDMNGTSIAFAEKCWIEKRPDVSYGREAGPREWVLRTGELTDVVGGT